MNAVRHPISPAAPGTESPCLQDAAADSVKHQTAPLSGVGEGRLVLADAEREEAIVRAGQAIEKHMAVWISDGCVAAMGDADRARQLMEQLIAGRSPEQIARMQADQARRMALEPGAERTA